MVLLFEAPAPLAEVCRPFVQDFNVWEEFHIQYYIQEIQTLVIGLDDLERLLILQQVCGGWPSEDTATDGRAYMQTLRPVDGVTNCSTEVQGAIINWLQDEILNLYNKISYDHHYRKLEAAATSRGGYLVVVGRKWNGMMIRQTDVRQLTLSVSG
jgi:hypothetical protein